MGANRSRQSLSRLVAGNVVWIGLLGTYVLLGLADPRVFSVNFVINVISYSSVLAVLSVGLAFVLIGGRFDLSLGANLGFTAMVGAWLMGTSAPASDFGLNPVLTILIILALGAGIGAVNASLVLFLRLNPFIVTLAMLLILQGLQQTITRSSTLYNLPPAFGWLGSTQIGRIPVAFIFAVVLVFAAQFALRRLPFGRDLFAVGGNEKAAFNAGIPVRRTIFLTFVLSGLCGAVGGWILAGQLDSASALLGRGVIFDVFAAVVIGGVSLYGGRGSMIGVLGGVLLLGVISTGLALLNVSSFLVESIRGAIILFAVVLDSLVTSRIERRQ